MSSKALFRANGDGTYDLEIDGRTVDHNVAEYEFSDSLRRRRHFGPAEVEDETGYRTKLGRR